MIQSRFKDADVIVEKHFRFLESDFGYRPSQPEGTSHALHAYLKRYRKGAFEVRVVLFDWDVPAKHWNVFFVDRNSKGSEIDWRTEQSIFTITSRAGVHFPPHLRDDVSAGRTTLDEIVRELAQATHAYATKVIEGDFSVFEGQS